MITIKQVLDMTPEQQAQAFKQVNAALKKDRSNLTALVSRASLLHVAKKPVEAIRDLEIVLDKRPNDMMVLQWISVLCGEARQFDKADKYSLKAVELAPAQAATWQLRGRVLDSMGKPGAAIEAFEKELALTTAYPELIFRIANCQFYTGELEKAEAGYRKTLEMEPTHAMALYGLSTIHKFSNDEVPAYIEQVEKSIAANQNMPPFNIAGLYFGAAKAFDDIKEHEKAFEYYYKANNVQAPGPGPSLEQHFENNKAAFHKLFMEKRERWGDQDSQPIFIIGMPRSGTTLVESILAAHSNVHAGGEMSFMDGIAMQLGSMHVPKAQFVGKVQKLNKQDIARMATSYLAGAHTICPKDSMFTDKLPHNFINVGLIFLLFPNAKIVHCRRDPADNCASIYTNGMSPAHNYYKSNLETLGRYYQMYEDIMAYWRELFPGRIHDVYYEDLITNTELNSRALIEYLELEWEDGVMERDGSNESFKTLSAWQVRQPVYTSSKGKWRRFESQLAPLLEQITPSMERYENELASLNQSGT